MKTIFQILVFLFAGINLSANVGRYEYYRGTIGDLKIEMTLHISDNKVDGFYHYIGRRGTMTLCNGVLKNSSLNIAEKVYAPVDIDETIQNRITGNFKGEYIPGVSFKGKWSTPGEAYIFDFSLTIDKNYNGVSLVEESVKTDSSFTNSRHDTVCNESAEINYLKVLSGTDSGPIRKINEGIFKALEPLSEEEEQSKIEFPHYKSLANNFVIYAHNLVVGDYGDSIPDDAMSNWDSESGAEIIWNGSGVLTVAVSQYIYTGGAHGNYGTDFFCYNISTGKEITLDDIFLPGYNEPLRKAAVKNIDQDPDFISRDSLPLNNNFSIMPDGIMFLYNPYEVSSYASGISTAFIPWREMNKWIDPKGVMGWARK